MLKLPSSVTLHYINTIKGCSVLKIQNVNSRGLVFKNLKDINEAECARHLVFKNLKDICEAECARHLHVPVRKELHDGCEDEVLNHSLPMAKRVKIEREHQVNMSGRSSNIDEIGSGFDDLSFGEITLMQLKKSCKTKKRKKPEFVCLSPKKELTESLQDEDDCDLTTPLSSWNVRLAISAKSKKKRSNSSASCAPMAIKVEVSPVCCPELQSLSFVTEAGYGSSSSDVQVNLSDMDSTKPCLTTNTLLENDEVISLAGQFETCVLNENSYSQLDENFMPNSFLHPISGTTEGPSTQEMGQHPSVSSISELQKEAETMHLPSRQSFLLIDKPVYDNRLVISSQSNNDMQEISGYETGDQASDVPLKNGTEIVHGSELCVLEDNSSTSSFMFNSSRCCFSMPEIFNNESRCPVSSVETDYSLWCVKSVGGIKLSVFKVIKSNMLQNLLDNFLRSPFCYYSSPWNSYRCSASNSDLVTPENDSLMIDDNRSLISDNSHTARNFLEPKLYLTCLEDSSWADKEKQLLLPVDTDMETSFSSNAVNQLSTAESNNHYDMVLWQPPERFPLMRKVISPTSQENLCLAMSSREKYDDMDDYKCKDKLFLGNQTEVSILSATSDIASGESYVTDESTGKGTLTKEIFSPRKILKKPKQNKKRRSSQKGHIEGLTKKRSSPKGRLEGSRRTRSLPGFCSGRTSVEAFRESVVAFSQRQMQDIESVAVNLMTELKSMKEFIEHKVFDEAYRCTSMKNDADEVKFAIKNAARVEEKTKKWLSMMTRDCNRFCKIMTEPQRSTEDAAIATENTLHKEKRISFADEAGGVLCHVKYFKSYKNNTGVTC